jgi:hypothetical protein
MRILPDIEQKIRRVIRDERARDPIISVVELHGEINRDFAYDIGLEARGRIKNLGGRIHELRKEGWDIKTDVRQGVCWYVLTAAPRAEQLSLASVRTSTDHRHQNDGLPK